MRKIILALAAVTVVAGSAFALSANGATKTHPTNAAVCEASSCTSCPGCPPGGCSCPGCK